jgi:AraC-like DNA-binding protein
LLEKVILIKPLAIFPTFAPVTQEYPKIYLYRRIVQAKLYIDTHYAENIELDNIADEAHFSKFHFLRLFKSTYGRTPHKYLTYVRIEQAMKLLRQGETVSGACYAVGFDSISSFSSLFRKSVGVSPSEYYQQQQVFKKEIRTVPLKHIPGCFAEMKGWKKNSNFEQVAV